MMIDLISASPDTLCATKVHIWGALLLIVLLVAVGGNFVVSHMRELDRSNLLQWRLGSAVAITTGLFLFTSTCLDSFTLSLKWDGNVLRHRYCDVRSVHEAVFRPDQIAAADVYVSFRNEKHEMHPLPSSQKLGQDDLPVTSDGYRIEGFTLHLVLKQGGPMVYVSLDRLDRLGRDAVRRIAPGVMPIYATALAFTHRFIPRDIAPLARRTG